MSRQSNLEASSSFCGPGSEGERMGENVIGHDFLSEAPEESELIKARVDFLLHCGVVHGSCSGIGICRQRGFWSLGAT